MTLTLPIGNFYCRRCEVSFKGEYKPQQRPRKSCPKCHKPSDLTPKRKKAQKGNSGRAANTKSTQKPQTQDFANRKDSNFIDDPNELLMSDAIRELNKQHPDVRWATILVNILKETKQLEAVNSDRDEIQSKLKQYSTKDLVKLRKKLTGNLQIDG